ncbi:hypothetical protein JG687_00005249, partial [Phytophthora cactorum]
LPATQNTTPGTHETAPLRKKRKVSLGNESEADAAHITLAVVPRIAGTTFTAWTEFIAFWDQFEREQSVVYRTRDCQTAKLYNITRTNHPKRQIPASFGYAFRKYVCTLGRKQKSRSTGKRAKRKERYRACKAMFRVAVVRADGIAYVRLKKGASSKHTVLSECEKYNVVRAEVIALVDGLQQLSSSKFYEIFADLRATVDIFKKKWDLDQISLLHPGVSDDDEDHDFDFDDSGEKGESTVEQVAQLPDENETDAPVAPDDLSQCVMMNPSQVSLPDIVVSEQSQETLQLEATTSPTPELEAHPADTLEMLKLPASSNARAKDLRKGSKWAITEFGNLDPSQDDVVPAAFLASEMGGFSMKYVRHLLEFFAINRIIDDYCMDLSWLEQDWCGVSGMSPSTAQTAMLWMLCLSPTRRFSFLTSCNFVLVPIHMNALEHWMVQTTETQMRDADTSKHKIWAKFYDPLGVSSNLDVCQAKWISFTLPLL